MSEFIYAYSTESDLKKNPPNIKIGSTRNDVDIRIRQQDTTSNSEPLIELYRLDVSKYGFTAYDFEKKLHNHYENFHIRKEWFGIYGGITELKNSVELLLNDSDVHKSDIELLPHQDDAYNDMGYFYEQGGKYFLLFIKCRSGKTFITIRHILKNDYKNVLIITSYPILNDQWIDQIKETKGFSDTDIITSNELSKLDRNDDRKKIIFLSLQDLKGGDGVLSKNKFDVIKNINFDLLIVDEVHSGVETEKTEELLNGLKYDRLLGLSATPSKNFLSGRFSKDQVFTYTLNDEYLMKKRYPDLYGNMPNINFLIWNLSDGEKKELKYFSDEEQFNFEKFFRVENGEFYYKSDILYLFRKLIGDRSLCSRDKLGTKYPFKNNGEFSKTKSILLYVPNTSVQEKLEILLNDIEDYNNVFDVHITNSKLNNSKQLLSKIKRDFKPKNGKRSLIIAVDQLTTGITLSDCDMVVFMNDTKSLDRYVQSLFRGQSPREDKEDCWVLDLNPARSFNLMREYQVLVTKYNSKTLTENISDWVECVNIFNRVEGEFIKLDFDGFNTEYYRLVYESIRFNYNSTILSSAINGIDIKKALTRLGLKGGSSSINKPLLEDGIDGGKSKNKTKSSTSKKELDDDVSVDKLMEIAKELLNKTMLLTIFTYFKYANIDDCFNVLMNDNTIVDGIGELERKMYLDTLLLGIKDSEDITLEDIKYIYDNLYDKNIINNKIYSFNQSVKLIYNNIGENPENISNMIENLMSLVNSYLTPSNTEKKIHAEVMTPFHKIEETLDMFDSSDWTNPNLKWFGPSAGLGNFQVCIVKRLMDGLKYWQPDDELRYKHIMENQIYISEIQSKNMFLFLMLFDRDHKYKLNFYRGSFLDIEFDKHMREVWKIDKFDRCVENPPFNQMVDMDFLVKCHSICDKFAFIHPSTWILDEKNKQKKFIKAKEIVKDSLEKFILFNGNKIFNIQLFVPICITFFNKEKDINGIYCKDYINDVELQYDNIYQINKYSNINEYVSIKNKVILKSNVNNLLVNKNKIHGGYFVNTAQIRGHVDLKSNKVMLKEDFYTFITKDSKVEQSNKKHMFFSFDSNEKAENFLNYLKTNFSRFCLSIFKSNSQLDRGELEIVPYLDFTQEWSDNKLYKYFELNESEIKFIEKSIPKYYD